MTKGQSTTLLAVALVACMPEPLDPFGMPLDTGVPLVGGGGGPCGPCNLFTAGPDGDCPDSAGAFVDDLVENAGSLEASTVFDDDLEQFGPELARDDDRTTSWFSAGPVDGTSTLTWTSSRDDCIVGVRILNNGEHANEDFRTGFGFTSAQVRLYPTGAVSPVWEGVADLSASPDPDVFLDVVGDGGVQGVFAGRLELAFSGHEDPTCGGISEVGVDAWFQ